MTTLAKIVYLFSVFLAIITPFVDTSLELSASDRVKEFYCWNFFLAYSLDKRQIEELFYL